MSAQGGEPLNRVSFWIAAVLAAAADLLSKHLAFAYTAADEHTSRPLIDGVLWCSRHINYGGVWGAMHGYNVLLLAFTALVIPAVVMMAYTCREPRAPLWALGLLLGGAFGNLVDRVMFNGVRDFIDLRWWPIFNVADIAIVVGVFFYLGWSLFFAPPEPATDPESTTTTEDNA